MCSQNIRKRKYICIIIISSIINTLFSTFVEARRLMKERWVRIVSFDFRISNVLSLDGDLAKTIDHYICPIDYFAERCRLQRLEIKSLDSLTIKVRINRRCRWIITIISCRCRRARCCCCRIVLFTVTCRRRSWLAQLNRREEIERAISGLFPSHCPVTWSVSLRI